MSIVRGLNPAMLVGGHGRGAPNGGFYWLVVHVGSEVGDGQLCVALGDFGGGVDLLADERVDLLTNKYFVKKIEGIYIFFYWNLDWKKSHRLLNRPPTSGFPQLMPRQYTRVCLLISNTRCPP